MQVEVIEQVEGGPVIMFTSEDPMEMVELGSLAGRLRNDSLVAEFEPDSQVLNSVSVCVRAESVVQELIKGIGQCVVAQVPDAPEKIDIPTTPPLEESSDHE